MKTTEASIMILILFFAFSTASFSALTNLSFGGKSGDWIEYLSQEQAAFGLTGDQWVRMEFLSVAGTNVTVNAAIYTASWTEMNKTETIDLTSQDDLRMDPWFNARVYFIPGGLGPNDSVYLGQVFGFETIVGETTRTYAGANRRVIYANFTQQENNYVFYWDKQTGVLTEGTKVLGVGFTDVLVSETNMWGTDFSWVLWTIITIAIALGVLSSRKSVLKKLRRKRDAHPTLTKVALFPSVFQKGKVNRNAWLYLAESITMFMSD